MKPIPKVRFPHIQRPRRPRRGDQTEMPDAALPAPGSVLRVFRVAALAAIAAVITAASSASFAESYRGLWLWARHHGLSGFWAAVFPLQVDAFIVTGELTLFIAMTDRWVCRDRAGAWTVALLGLVVSVGGNVGHVAAHDLQLRGTAAVPPLAAFIALWIGLGVLKRVAAPRGQHGSARVGQSRRGSGGCRRGSEGEPAGHHRGRQSVVRESADRAVFADPCPGDESSP